MPSRKRSKSRRRRSSSCGKGQIRRVSYTTKRGRYVPPPVLKILPTPKKGKLYPYKESYSKSKRHSILKRLAKRDSTARVLRRVNLIKNYSTRGSAQRKPLSGDVKYMEKLLRQKRESSVQDLRREDAHAHADVSNGHIPVYISPINT